MPSPAPPRVLYLHPYAHPEPRMIPAGAVAALNGLGAAVAGRYAEQVADEELAAAAVVLLDLHWFTALACVDGMIAEIRRLNPAAAIVAAGETASFFGEALLARPGGALDVDYILFGDAEVGLGPLVSALLAGERPERLPNVLCRRHGAGPKQRLSQAAFDRLDRLDAGWFPAFAHYQREQQAGLEHGPRLDLLPPPYLIPQRGCARRCERRCSVAGAERPMRQSRAALVDELRRAEALDDVHCVSLVLARGALAHYAPALRGERWKLGAALFVCEIPDAATLDALEGAFALGVVLHLYWDPCVSLGGLSGDPVDAADADARLRRLAGELERRPQVKAKLFFGDRPPPEWARGPEGGRMDLDFSRDCAIIRPGAGDAGRRPDDARHLEEVAAAARSAGEAHLMTALAQGVRTNLYGWWSSAKDRADDAALRREQPLREMIERRLRHDHAYGFSTLRLAVGAARAAPGETAGWRRLFGRLPAVFTWTPRLQEFAWEAELRLNNPQPIAVGPVPVVEGGGERIDLGAWEHLRFPSAVLPAGPPRVARVGGMRFPISGETRMWIEDRGARQEWRFRDDGSDSAASVAGVKEPRASTPDGMLDEPSEDWTRAGAWFPGLIGAPWPDPKLAARLFAMLAKASEAGYFGRRRLTGCVVLPTHGVAVLTDAAGAAVVAVVAPKGSSSLYAATRRFIYAYKTMSENDDARDFVPRWARLLERAENG